MDGSMSTDDFLVVMEDSFVLVCICTPDRKFTSLSLLSLVVSYQQGSTMTISCNMCLGQDGLLVLGRTHPFHSVQLTQLKHELW